MVHARGDSANQVFCNPNACGTTLLNQGSPFVEKVEAIQDRPTQILLDVATSSYVDLRCPLTRCERMSAAEKYNGASPWLMALVRFGGFQDFSGQRVAIKVIHKCKYRNKA